MSTRIIASLFIILFALVGYLLWSQARLARQFDSFVSGVRFSPLRDIIAPDVSPPVDSPAYLPIFTTLFQIEGEVRRVDVENGVLRVEDAYEPGKVYQVRVPRDAQFNTFLFRELEDPAPQRESHGGISDIRVGDRVSVLVRENILEDEAGELTAREVNVLQLLSP